MIYPEQSENLEQLFKKYPEKLIDFLHSCNESQWSSKLWIMKELNPYLSKFGKQGPYKIAVLGGWYGLLSYVMIKELRVKIKQIDSFDIDSMTSKIGKIFNKDVVNYYIKDVAEINFGNTYDIIINTSSEHMVQETINHTIDSSDSGTIFVLENNDFRQFGEIYGGDKVLDHINCSDSKEEFANKYRQYFNEFVTFTKPWKSSNGPLGNNYDRYLGIGIKK
tara:strand:+ start:2070 stop:2732 length:663 start_codon:yes stop_codon:yes gene_type:complete